MARHVFLTGPPGDPGPARLGGEGARPGQSVSPALAAVAVWLGALQPGGREGREERCARFSGPQRPAVTMVLSYGGRVVLCRLWKPLRHQRRWRGAEDSGRRRASLAQHALRLKSGCIGSPASCCSVHRILNEHRTTYMFPSPRPRFPVRTSRARVCWASWISKHHTPSLVSQVVSAPPLALQDSPLRSLESSCFCTHFTVLIICLPLAIPKGLDFHVPVHTFRPPAINKTYKRNHRLFPFCQHPCLLASSQMLTSICKPFQRGLSGHQSPLGPLNLSRPRARAKETQGV